MAVAPVRCFPLEKCVKLSLCFYVNLLLRFWLIFCANSVLNVLTMKKLVWSVAVLFTGFVLVSFSGFQDEAMQQSMKRGATVYANNCAMCHMAEGEGIPGAIPPVAKSDYLMKDQRRAIRQVLYGAKGEMVVNGVKYNNEMPAQNHLTDQEIADVLNYIQNSWGNKQPKMVTAAQVKAERARK